MNMIRSVDDNLETANVKSDDVNETAPEKTKAARKKRDVENLRNIFHSAVQLVRNGDLEDDGKKKKLVLRIAKKMSLLRKKRELDHPETKTMMENSGHCTVMNMTCSAWPLKSKCKGIGIGRCGSNADLLKQLFTPNVVMVSSVSIIIIVMVTVGLSYYCYKL